MKLLTVVIPCYNSQDYMEKCVLSMNPTDDRLEILIIDDGSKDNTGKIADELEARYPGNVRAIHQENGGHGEGINHGLREATGKYFKTVDSDDTLSSDFSEFLARLAKCDEEGGIDLFVTDYRYIHADGKGDRTIDFSNAFPIDRIFGWDETRRFRIDQILMIHTCTFRTDLLRENGVVLPIHTFYEDNYYIYANLVNCKKIYYMHSALYLYAIGREGQSVQNDVMMRRYTHQIKATELCFTAFHLAEVNQKRLKKYLEHEMYIMFCIATIFSRLNKSDQADNDLKKMWENCYAFDKKQANHFRWHTSLILLCVPGKFGRLLVRFIFFLSHKVVRFN